MLSYRDPTARLGAWENPPHDIMSTSFFKSIDWDSLMERRQDGPYIPEISPYYATSASGRRESVEKKQRAEDDEFKRFTMNNTNSTPYINRSSKVEEQDEDEEESDEDELMNLRDSIFVTNKNDNKLLDWSFIDAEVLMSSTKAPLPTPPPATTEENNENNVVNNNLEKMESNEELETVSENINIITDQQVPQPVVTDVEPNTKEENSSNNNNNNTSLDETTNNDIPEIPIKNNSTNEE